MALRDWLALTRFEHAVMVFVAVIASQAIVLKRFDLAFVLPAVGPALITLAAFALNDFFGLKSDKMNKRFERPLVARRIKKPENALRFAVVFYALGLLACLLFANQTAFKIALAYVFLSVVYEPLLKKIPLMGNVFIASAMSVSFIYGNYAASPFLLEQNIVVFSAMAFLGGLGREFLITLRDVKGDARSGYRTLPMLIGARKTVVLANAFFYSAVLVSLTPLMKKIFIPYVILVILADALFVLTALKISLDSSVSSLKQARDYTLWALIIGLVAFATLVFE